MKTWWLVVRHSAPPPGGFYPPEGFAVSAFDEQERAELFAKSSTTPSDRYEAIPVVDRRGLMKPAVVRPVYPIEEDE